MPMTVGSRVLPRRKASVAQAVEHLRIRYLRVTELKPDPQNPRVHTDKQIRQIAASIRAFGFNVPILIDSKLKVLAGHGRLQACPFVGIKEVPTIMLENLNEAQLWAFMIADNRLTENATWNDRLLGEQLKALSEVELDFSLEVTGFDIAEIDLRIEGLGVVNPEADRADELPDIGPRIPVSQPGDLWLLGRHRVFCGSALDASAYATVMNGERAAMVFTDPPYN